MLLVLQSSKHEAYTNNKHATKESITMILLLIGESEEERSETIGEREREKSNMRGSLDDVDDGQ